MLKYSRSVIARLAGDSRGASIIETALVAPIMLMLMAGAVDFAMAFSVKLRTQQAAARSIEFATTSGVENVSASGLQADAAAAANVSTSNVTVNRWVQCDSEVRDFEAACDDGQVLNGRYVSVQIQNSYSPMLGPLLPQSIARRGSIPFSGFATVRLQ